MSPCASPDRQRNREKEHKYLMAERLAVKEEQDNHLAGNLQLNTNLASRYRQLRNRAVTRQSEFLDQMDQKMALQNKLKDLQQVMLYVPLTGNAIPSTGNAIRTFN